MAIETLLGVRVYADRNTAVPPPRNWRDIRDFFLSGRKAFSTEEAFNRNLAGRFSSLPSWKTTIAHLLKHYLKGGDLPTEVLRDLHVNLGGSDRCNLKHSPYQTKNIRSLSELTVKGDRFKGPVQAALQCHDAGCVAYQKEILSLLRPCGNTVINAGQTLGQVEDPVSKTKVDATEYYGQDALPEKVKVFTVLPLGKKDSPVQIRVKFNSMNYIKDSGSHSRHAEILSGILFEAGNVYAGNYGDASSSSLEIDVSAHNCSQVARIAKNWPVTQNDWRNLMKLLFSSDVNTQTFQRTSKYVAAYKGALHDIGAPNVRPPY